MRAPFPRLVRSWFRCAGLTAQVGYGTVGADPATFTWTDSIYNTEHFYDDNDEYWTTMTPTSVGTYEYAYRFSGDGGSSWTYCDTSGSGDGYQSANAGRMTVE